MLVDQEMEIPLNEIRLDGIQARQNTNLGYIETYMEDMEKGDKFPPIVLFQDNKGYFWIGDGWHRIKAALRLGLIEIKAIIKPGTKRDAMLYNIESNRKHRGIPLTVGDKKRGCLLLLRDSKFEFLTDDRIAAMVGCSASTVQKTRQLMTDEGHKFSETRLSAKGRVVYVKPKVKKEKKEEVEVTHRIKCPYCQGKGYMPTRSN